MSVLMLSHSNERINAFQTEIATVDTLGHDTNECRATIWVSSSAKDRDRKRQETRFGEKSERSSLRPETKIRRIQIFGKR